ncbi:MAG: START domain-containing protein [Cyclobacteriaceae bacterium]
MIVNFKIIVFGLSCVLLSLSVNAQEWETAKSEDGVKAYTYTRESGIKSVKVETTIEASIEKVYNFITDYDNPKEWKHSTRSSKIVDRTSPNEFKVYFVIATPWPLKDRDFYADVSVSFTEGKDRCEIIFIPDTEQESHGSKIRMTNFDTRWVLTEEPEGKIKVELYSYGDPVGVPISFVNMFIVDTPFKTVQNLKRDITTYQ